MSKIIRRPDFAGGGLTQAERDAMAEHAQLWIARAMRTDPIEPEKIGAAIGGLYRAAGLAPPRVVIVPSPLVMALAGPAAQHLWETGAATKAATIDATRDATRAATRAASIDATKAATDGVTYAATEDATRAAT